MRFIADLCALGDAKRLFGRTELAAPTSSELAALIDDAPPMRGGEYLRPDVLARHWGEIGQALEAELTESGLSLNEFLKARDSRWRLVGRVHFNLAENRRDPECPYASMATYSSGLGASGALRHLTLGQALREFAGVGDKAKLLQLLDPVSRASEACSWLKAISLTPARSFIPCGGRRRRRCAFSTMSMRWSRPASSFACRRTGA
jgi:non-specific serine/threonine protein kinase